MTTIRLSFKSQITKEQFILNCQSNNDWLLVKKSETRWSLKDESFDSEATIQWLSEDQAVIATAWSGFKYYLTFLKDEVLGIYEGNFGGLFEQNLLPNINADIDIYNTIYSNKYGEERLIDYAARRFNRGHRIPSCIWQKFISDNYFEIIEDRGYDIVYSVNFQLKYEEAVLELSKLRENPERNGNGDPFTYSIEVETI